MKLKKGETTGPLLSKAGEVLVDPKKFPTLHRSLRRGLERFHDGWERVVRLRKKGGGRRLVRKLLGIKGEPMSEEVKERLRNKGKGEEE